MSISLFHVNRRVDSNKLTDHCIETQVRPSVYSLSLKEHREQFSVSKRESGLPCDFTAGLCFWAVEHLFKKLIRYHMLPLYWIGLVPIRTLWIHTHHLTPTRPMRPPLCGTWLFLANHVSYVLTWVLSNINISAPSTDPGCDPTMLRVVFLQLKCFHYILLLGSVLTTGHPASPRALFCICLNIQRKVPTK